jgi:tetratricopeptide (TPR) repeat protein
VILRWAELAFKEGDPDAAESHLLTLIDEPDLSRQERSDVTYLHARVLEAKGRLEAAAAAYARLESDPDGIRWLQARIGLSRCYREAGDLARAIDIAEDALEQVVSRQLTGLDEAVQLSLTLAAAYFERGDTFHAARICSEAIDEAERRGSHTARASAYWNASVISYNRGESRQAITLAERALALLGEGEDARNLSRLRLQLGATLLRADPPQTERAETLLSRARRELEANGAGQVDLARCDLNLATARVLEGDLDSAERLAEQALTEATESPLASARIHALLGRVYVARGAVAEARAAYRAAVAKLTGAAADREAAQLWYQLGAMLQATGEESLAADAFRRAGASLGLEEPAFMTVRV